MPFDQTPEYQALLAQVTATVGAEASATVGLNALGAYIQANAGNRAAMLALATTLQQPTVDLAAAVAANPVPA